MNGYPKARWSIDETSVGASLWTQEVPKGGGGGYYLYTWERDAGPVLVEELVQGTTEDQRRAGERSAYAWVGEIAVPGEVLQQDARGQEIGVARLMHADMQQRFGSISEWIGYGNDGKPVWFHSKVTGR